MKKTIFIAIFTTFLCAACAHQEAAKPSTATAIADTEMGLSKTSVFDTPTPQSFSYSENPPGSGTTLPRAYPGAPPQIPHNIDNFKPITAKVNACLACHHNPSMRGKKITGMPTAIPESHYIDRRNEPGVVGSQIVGARYVCTQCHVPQANVAPLVDNVFQSDTQP